MINKIGKLVDKFTQTNTKKTHISKFRNDLGNTRTDTNEIQKITRTCF